MAQQQRQKERITDIEAQDTCMESGHHIIWHSSRRMGVRVKRGWTS
jgi:hypothetical protein